MKHQRRRAGAAAAWALAGWTALNAAAEPIATDRPDFVESSDVVGRGHVQIEAGLSFERSNGQRLRSTPLLLRVGVSETLELRLETDGALRSSGGGAPREKGYADASPGLKWHLRDGDEKAGTPGLALLAHVDVDSGSAAFRGQGLRPSLRGVAEWELADDFSLGVMPGLVWDKAPDGRRFTAGILAVTLGKSFTPAWRGFVELAGQQIAARKNGGSVVTFDAGVTWLANEALQFDLAFSRGLNKDAPDLQWGLGVSVRF
jgi:hypothetical protein